MTPEATGVAPGEVSPPGYASGIFVPSSPFLKLTPTTLV